jgi:N-sulfoglucosamine sulfohydrolase
MNALGRAFRWTFGEACCFALFFCVPVAPSFAEKFSEPPRGIILLVADDLGSDLLGSFGEAPLRTPHLDRFAREGTQFPLAFASASTCSPSRSVLYTGLPSHANGQYGIAHGMSHFAQFDSVATLPSILKRARFKIGWIGKTHVLPEKSYPVDWTWDGEGRDVMAMARAAKDFLASAKNRPFLLIVGYVDPHRPFGNNRDHPGVREIEYDPKAVAIPPSLTDRWPVRQEVSLYWQSISRLDQGVGALLETLRNSGREDETLVIFASDNGAPFPLAKTNLYDAGIRVPLVIRNPVQIRRNVVSNAMVSFADVFATILDWARVPKPDQKELRARSVLPILEETNPAGWNEIYASQSFHEVTMYYPMRAVRTRQHKLIVNLAFPLPFPIAGDVFDSDTWEGIIHHPEPSLGGRPLSQYIQRPRIELYDVIADPSESKNLAADSSQASVVRELEQRLRDWQERTADPWIVKAVHE